MIDGSRHDSRASVLSVLLLTVVFVAGALTGALVFDRAFAASPGNGESISDVAGMESLGLTADQQATIDAILSARQPRADSIIQSSMDALRALMEEADAEIRGVMTPEQMSAYDDLLAQKPRIRAVRRTVGPEGTTVDTIR